jgi:hypothetical protein
MDMDPQVFDRLRTIEQRLAAIELNLERQL